MAISSGQLQAGTTCQQIDTSSSNPFKLHIHNNEATTSIYVGNSEVTTENGLRLESKDSLELFMNAGESIYVISTSNNHLITWLKQEF
jgi:diaminopimelate epimerase